MRFHLFHATTSVTISSFNGGSGLAPAPSHLAPPGGNAAASVAMSREVSEVQAAMVIARSFPRNIMQALERVLNACTRPSLAEGALYTYSRGGQDVSGPSIRLAEAIAQEWGNLQFGIRELSQGDGVSSVEAFAWDIERNVRQVKVFQVVHERHTRAGAKRLTDPRDIYELVANQGARRLRACILGVIPGDVIEAAVSQCEATLKASAGTGPEVQQALVAKFAEFGVTKGQIEARIQRRLDAIQPAQVVLLRKIYQGLKDGLSRPADWFEADQGAGIAPPAGAEVAAAPVSAPQMAPASAGGGVLPPAIAHQPVQAHAQAAPQVVEQEPVTVPAEVAEPAGQATQAAPRRVGRPRQQAPQAAQAAQAPEAVAEPEASAEDSTQGEFV